MAEHPNVTVLRSAYEAFAKGDVATLAQLLDEDIVWHESTRGFEGDYRGLDQVLALLGRFGQETGGQMSISIHDVLASDDHAVILQNTTISRKGRTYTGQYADVFHVQGGMLAEHWHLAVDPKADDEFWT
jgi:ketosteroid isomerase-like protein